METIKFKTNIKCGSCLATVSPYLNELAGKDSWKVELDNPERILSVTSSRTENEIVAAVKEAGFGAEKI